MIGVRSSFCSGQARWRTIYCNEPTCRRRKGRALPIAIFDDPLAFVVGMLMGVIGFSPFLIAVIAGRGRRRSIRQGLLAIMLSSGFLTIAVGIIWLRSGSIFLTAFAGMLVGFFAMWAILAYMARKRRL